MSVASDTSDTDEPDRSRPSTLAEYRAPEKCSIRFCYECFWISYAHQFDTARNKKRRIFASGKWREVTIPQWDEYLGKYGAKRKPYTWNPGKRIGAERECAQQDPLDKDERGSSSNILSPPGSPEALLLISISRFPDRLPA
jgi:hypothetical protein